MLNVISEKELSLHYF